MPFKPGQPRVANAGRRKGTPNRKTELLIDKCERMGVDVFEGLLELTKHHDVTIRLHALKEVAQYILPKRKALDLNADVDVAMLDKAKEIKNMPKEERVKLLEAELKKLKATGE